MKKLLTILTFAFFVHANAQVNVYHPFPNTYGDWWVRTSYYPNNTAGPVLDDLYFTTGDTVVNSLTYKKVNHIYKGNAAAPPPAINYIFTGGAYNFAYRNDSLHKKVYLLPLDSTHETLWYDFNLNLGDTLKGNYANGNSQINSGAYLVVTAIDSVLSCGTYYKSYICKCPSANFTPPIPEARLTESMGFNLNFITNSVGNICAMEPSQIPSTYVWSINACPNGLGIKTVSATNHISIYPNPAQNNFTVHVSTDDKQTLTVYDITGKQVLAQTIIGTTSIDASNLQNGIYFIQLKNNTGLSAQKLIVQH